MVNNIKAKKMMIFSDLHFDINQTYLKKSMQDMFSSFLYESSPDVVLIAGDLSNNADNTIRIIDKVKKDIGIPIIFISGNHDVWTESNSSLSGYQKLLEHPNYLSAPILLNDNYAIIGGMGWYDYSFVSASEQLDALFHKPNLWNDAKYAKWGGHDAEVLDPQLDRWEKQLETTKDRKIIFVNHFIPFVEYVTYIRGNAKWNLSNAYMGSKRTGELIDKYHNITHVVFGHTHRRYGVTTRNDKITICSPLGYKTDWETDDPVQEFKKSAITIEL